MQKVKHHFSKSIRNGVTAALIAAAVFLLLHLIISLQVRKLLPALVARLSEGQYHFQYSSVHFRYFSPHLLLTNARLEPVGTSMEAAYTVSVDTLSLGIESVLPLLLNNEVTVHSLQLIRPAIRAERRRIAKWSRDAELHEQVSRLQDNAMKFLNALHVKECLVRGASFRFYPFPGDRRHFNLENIDLEIRDLVIPKYTTTTREQIKAAVRLELHDPKLKIPDSALELNVSHFVWDNQAHYVNVSAFSIAQRPGVRRDSFRILLDTIRVRKIDWSLWLDSGIVRLDTLLANNGTMYFSSGEKAAPGRLKSDTLSLRELKFWDAIGNLDIHYFSARYIHAALINRHLGKERDFSLLGDSLLLKRLSVRPAKSTPMVVEDLALAVRGFADKGVSNRFQSSFSGLHLKGSTLELRNYLIASTRQHKRSEGASLFIPTLFLEGISFQDIFDKRASIREIRMESPVIRIARLPQVRGSAFRRFSGLEDVRPYLDVDRLLIHKASLELTNSGQRLLAEGISADILAHDALQARNQEALLASLQDVSVDLLEFQSPQHQLKLQRGMVDYGLKSLRFQQVDARLAEGRISAALQHVAIDAMPELRPLESEQVWRFRRVDVGTGNIVVTGFPKRNSSRAPGSFSGTIDQLRLGSVGLRFNDGKAKGYAQLTSVNAADARLLGGKLSWQLAGAAGTKLMLQLPGIEVNSGNFQLNSAGESVLDSASIQIEKPGISARITARQVISQEEFRSYDPDTLVFDRIVLVRPVIEANIADAEKRKADTRTFMLGSKSFDLEDPVFRLTIGGITDPFHLDASGEFLNGEDVFFDQVNGKSQFSVRRLNASFDRLDTRAEGKDVMHSGALKARLSRVTSYPGSIPVVDIDQFSIEELNISRIRRGDTILVSAGALETGEINRLFLQKDSILQAAFKLPPIRMAPANVEYRTPSSAFGLFALQVNTAEGFLSWDSLKVLNRTPREMFFQSHPFEKDYFTVSTGKLKAEDLRPVVYGRDTVAYARKISVDPLHLKVERDKRVQDDTVSYRPLLGGMLKRLRFPVQFDTLQLHRSVIWHNIIDEKTEREGTIFFTEVEATLANLKNVKISEMDSIHFTVNSQLMGKGLLELRYHQSYADPRESFHLGVRMGAMEMQELNRLIGPLQSVRADTGTIRRVNLNIRGNDSIAFGTMMMEYHNLKISVMNQQDKRRSLYSWFANLFVRGKNHKSSPIFIERLSDKSVFNYWSRISLTGLLTNLGIRKNGKKTRQFYRRLPKEGRPAELF